MLKRISPMFFLITGMLLLLIGMVHRSFTDMIENPGAAPLPERIVELSRIRVNYGEEAIAEVAQLHGKEFPLSSGASATYGRPGSMVTLWVTGTPSRFLSMGILSQMKSTIESEESPFTPTGVRQIDGRDAHELSGMGQRHFYFRSAELVIWLAVDETIAEEALAETVAFYP